MVFVVEFKTKEVLTHILIGLSIKRRAEAIGGNDQGSAECGFVNSVSVEEVLDFHTWFQRNIRGWVDGMKFDVLVTKVIVVARQRYQMLWRIEGFPQECANWAWGGGWRWFQLEGFNVHDARRVNPNKNVALACNCVSEAWEGNIIKFRDAPASQFELLPEGFDAAADVIRDNDSYNQMKVPESLQLCDDRRLPLSKCRCGLAVLKT
jgi:hypothetical protein